MRRWPRSARTAVAPPALGSSGGRDTHRHLRVRANFTLKEMRSRARVGPPVARRSRTRGGPGERSRRTIPTERSGWPLGAGREPGHAAELVAGRRRRRRWLRHGGLLLRRPVWALTASRTSRASALRGRKHELRLRGRPAPALAAAAGGFARGANGRASSADDVRRRPGTLILRSARRRGRRGRIPSEMATACSRPPSQPPRSTTSSASSARSWPTAAAASPRRRAARIDDPERDDGRQRICTPPPALPLAGARLVRGERAAR